MLATTPVEDGNIGKSVILKNERETSGKCEVSMSTRKLP